MVLKCLLCPRIDAEIVEVTIAGMTVKRRLCVKCAAPFRPVPGCYFSPEYCDATKLDPEEAYLVKVHLFANGPIWTRDGNPLRPDRTLIVCPECANGWDRTLGTLAD